MVFYTLDGLYNWQHNLMIKMQLFIMRKMMRNLIGYGENPPIAQWPNDAKIAINFVLNYEEGAETNILDGDTASENWLAEIAGMNQLVGERNYFSESIFEYGSRAGAWRLLKMFEEFKIPISVFATGLALERNPEIAKYLAASDHEMVGHSYRWISYSTLSTDQIREQIRLTLQAIKTHTGKQAIGWFSGRSFKNIRDLLVEANLLYDSDNFADDLPYWTSVGEKAHLIIPYSFDNNDSKFSMSPGWMSGDDFFKYLCASFDCLYREGAHSPKMMTIGLHGRLCGRPGRAESLRRFIDYIMQHENVWVCKRSDIAHHWMKYHPPKMSLGVQYPQNHLASQEAD